MLVFLDAVGTVFGVKESVGYAYALIAERYGVQCDRLLLDRAFMEAFRHSPPMIFPDLDLADIPSAEYQWWQEIAWRTFAKTGDLARFTDFSVFFAELFAYFASAEPWFVYADTLLALKNWRSQGIELGIISNFDSRLYRVLAELELADYFSSVTISTEANSAKPSPVIFQYALSKHSSKSSAVHIGDSYAEDYQGANNSGIRGIWLNRQPTGQETVPFIRKLTEFVG